MGWPYRLFASEDHDWFVAAKWYGESNPSVIYEGHSRSEAYRAILEDIGLEEKHLDPIEANMEGGSYEPSASDWR